MIVLGIPYSLTTASSCTYCSSVIVASLYPYRLATSYLVLGLNVSFTFILEKNSLMDKSIAATTLLLGLKTISEPLTTKLYNSLRCGLSFHIPPSALPFVLVKKAILELIGLPLLSSSRVRNKDFILARTSLIYDCSAPSVAILEPGLRLSFSSFLILNVPHPLGA